MKSWAQRQKWYGPNRSRRYKEEVQEYTEIEENNRMGKMRDLFKKIRDTKGTFHAKMGLIKDRNVWT